MKHTIPAVVLGSCTHALAICRSLGKKGVPVFLVQESKKQPVAKTRYAKSLFVSSINSEALIGNLIDIRHKSKQKPILFLTNDNMVSIIAKHYNEVSKHYHLNIPDLNEVIKLSEKSNLELYSQKVKFNYPKTFYVKRASDIETIINKIKLPVIVKPSKPLFEFKGLKIRSMERLVKEIKRYEDGIHTFLVQEWIEGTDRDLYVINFYFNKESKPIAHFTGRKINSAPKLTGATSSMEGISDKELLKLGLRFFSKVDGIKGFASLELKKTRENEYYIIEPTIGRTDFYALACIINNVDFPYIQYRDLVGEPLSYPIQKNKRIWVDFQREMENWIEYLSSGFSSEMACNIVVKRPVFALWAIDDPLPSIFNIFKLMKRINNKIKKIVGFT